MVESFLKSVTECDTGISYDTVNNINGIGNVVTPDMIATGAVEQSGVDNVGSGDKFTGSKKTKSKRYYVTIKNKDGFGSLYKVKENLTYEDAVSMCEELNTNLPKNRYIIYGRPVPEYVVYEMNEITE